VHPKVRELCRGHPVGVKAASHRNAEGNGMLGQELIDLGGVPAGVAKLQNPAALFAQEQSELAQPRKVDLLIGRELEQDGPQLGAQVVRPLEEQVKLAAHLTQTLDVGDVPTCFNRKLERLGSDLPPPLEHLGRGQAVERVVQFYGLKLRRIVGQLLPCRGAWWVKHPLSPMPVNVSRGAKPDLRQGGHFAYTVAGLPLPS